MQIWLEAGILEDASFTNASIVGLDKFCSVGIQSSKVRWNMMRVPSG